QNARVLSRFLSLPHLDALPMWISGWSHTGAVAQDAACGTAGRAKAGANTRRQAARRDDNRGQCWTERDRAALAALARKTPQTSQDRKSTRLNSTHEWSSSDAVC